MRLAALAFATALVLPACDLWDDGELAVTVAPAPVKTGQVLTVTVTNGTQRDATYNACASLGLYRTGTTFAKVLPTAGTVCTQDVKTLKAGGSFTHSYTLTGVAAGEHLVRFTPTMDGGEALEDSAPFQITN